MRMSVHVQQQIKDSIDVAKGKRSEASKKQVRQPGPLRGFASSASAR